MNAQTYSRPLGAGRGEGGTVAVGVVSRAEGAQPVRWTPGAWPGVVVNGRGAVEPLCGPLQLERSHMIILTKYFTRTPVTAAPVIERAGVVTLRVWSERRPIG